MSAILDDSMIMTLAGWLAGWLACWLAGWLASWLAGWRDRLRWRGHGFLGGDTGFWQGTRVSGRGHGFLGGDEGLWQGTKENGGEILPPKAATFHRLNAAEGRFWTMSPSQLDRDLLVILYRKTHFY